MIIELYAIPLMKYTIIAKKTHPHVDELWVPPLDPEDSVDATPHPAGCSKSILALNDGLMSALVTMGVFGAVPQLTLSSTVLLPLPNWRKTPTWFPNSTLGAFEATATASVITDTLS